ncbi:MAG: hypothetical protein U0667_08225 [Chloroflexota bacterium]|jgi:uncharacterized spore protein YtfJ
MGPDAVSEEVQGLADQERKVDRLIEALVERFGGRTGVHTVFSDPVERDGVTVIPVARVRWLAGAGAGSGGAGGPAGQGAAEGEGAGGGGGVIGDPVGYVEVGSGGARFVPIRGVPNPLAILALGVSVALVLRALARIIGR